MTESNNGHTHLGRDALDRLLDGEGKAQWHAHLDGCVRCREELSQLRTLVTSLESLPSYSPSPGFTERVMARVQLPAPRAARRSVRQWLGWAAVPSAAAAAVAAAVGWIWILSRPAVSLRVLAAIVFDAVQQLAVAASIELGEFLVATGVAPAVRQMLTEMSTTGALGALGAFALTGLAVTVLAVTSLQRRGAAWQTTRRL